MIIYNLVLYGLDEGFVLYYLWSITYDHLGELGTPMLTMDYAYIKKEFDDDKEED